MRLISYKMTHDSGFAPNPFHGYLTLATCKPGIRRAGSRRIGDWIAGFTSAALCGDRVGCERLVYLMRVDEICTLADYFRDPRFAAKIPRKDSPDWIERVGDNIYKSLVDAPRDAGDYEQVPNDSHPPESKDHDVGGRNVLVARTGNYFYFGRNALSIPAGIRPDIPAGQSGYGKATDDRSRVDAFVAFVQDRFDESSTAFPSGVNGWPQSSSGALGSFDRTDSIPVCRAHPSASPSVTPGGCAR